MGRKILGSVLNDVLNAVGWACFMFGTAAFARMGWDHAGRDSHANEPQNKEEA